MLNWIFLALIVISVVTAAFTGTMPAVSKASLDAAKSAVDLAIALIGQMALWLGFMGVLREAGLMRSLARLVRPVMTRLFPDVPPDHPAMSAMIMNIAANMLQLGNAATPFGLKAMSELDKLNPHKGIATNAMALFLAINTSGVVLLSLNVVALRAGLPVPSKHPAAILLPSLIATTCSTVAAIVVCKLVERRRAFAVERYLAEAPAVMVPASPIAGLEQAEQAALESRPASGARLWASAAIGVALAAGVGMHLYYVPAGQSRGDVGFAIMSDWLLPLLMVAIVLFGMGRRVRIYEAFIASAKEGFQIGVMIIPYLVAILVAVAMFRASGAMGWIVSTIGPLTSAVGFPAEALPIALIRPLSGGASLGVLAETMKTYGADSFIGNLVSVIYGSTETTFYVLAVYFGAIGVRATRHTVIPCLSADVMGVVAATAVCYLFFG